ncbi:hypothetical protein EWS82_13100 [Staphylococcus xylosus]|nr:hypothetical protein [Staphylococcus xylosus]
MGMFAMFAEIMMRHWTIVVPKQTSWFTEVNGTENIPLRKQTQYKEDWLGLRQLDSKGGLRFRSITGDHMQITLDVLKEVMSDFLGPVNKSFPPEKTAEDVSQGEL